MAADLGGLAVDAVAAGCPGENPDLEGIPLGMRFTGPAGQGHGYGFGGSGRGEPAEGYRVAVLNMGDRFFGR